MGYHSPPPKFQLAFHIYYVKYEITLSCKRISWNLGGGGNDVLKIWGGDDVLKIGGKDDVLKIFFYFLYV